jgi:NAD(P)-dependent dehydrogenase (short-subunit alcohol dehydrogenase family)
MARLEGKTAIVTGSGSGMGRAIAELFAQEGAFVVLSDIDANAGEAVAEGIGDRARFVLQDVANEPGWSAVTEAAVKETGQLDLLVNNAGSALEGTPEDTDLDTWRRVNAVNVEGVFLGCRAVIPHMAENGGAIVNIASRAAIGAAPPYLAAYGASKGAVRQYTKTVAIYCAREGYEIRCNSINPGAIDTPLLQASFDHGDDPEARKAMIIGRIPAKRLGRPIDIAYAALFLASDEAAYITGAELNVDGGVTAI